MTSSSGAGRRATPRTVLAKRSVPTKRLVSVEREFDLSGHVAGVLRLAGGVYGVLTAANEPSQQGAISLDWFGMMSSAWTVPVGVGRPCLAACLSAGQRAEAG
jgi:hypothetical protein